VRQFGYLQGSYQDARSTKHKIQKLSVRSRTKNLKVLELLNDYSVAHFIVSNTADVTVYACVCRLLKRGCCAQGHDKNNAIYMNGSMGWLYLEIENKDGKR